MSNNTALDTIKVGLIFLGRKRPGFDPQWGEEVAGRVRKFVAETEFDTCEPSVKVIDDTTLIAAVEECKQKHVDVIVTLQTTMADMRMAPTFSQHWSNPIVLWTTPENQESDTVSSCSLVGNHAWASTLWQMRHPFEMVYGDPTDARTRQQYIEAVQLAHTYKQIHTARLGIIGSQAPGFFGMASDLFSSSRGMGVQVQNYTLVEYADIVNSFGEKEIAADIAKVKALGIPHKDTTDEDLPMASCMYMAFRHFMDAEAVDALSFRCWPEMPNMFGQWPYLAMARLSGEDRSIACEGDVDGALTALAGKYLGMGPCQLSDWLEHDDETITLWHTGTAPLCLAPAPGEPGGPQIARHFNNNKPAVVESTLKADMPITICRLWHSDSQYMITACDSQTVIPRRHLRGTNGLARLDDRNPREWFDSLCHHGMPHHVSVFAGHHTGLLRRFARMMQMQWVD
jgi:L-fucose isomerase-like protein